MKFLKFSIILHFTNKFIFFQIEEWLAQLLEEKPLSVKKLEKIDELYKLSSLMNSEIRFRWLRLCIRGKWKLKIKPSLEFITEQGRMKFVRPLYR